MRYLKWAALVLTLVLLSVFARTSIVHAQRFAIFVGNGQVVNNSLYSYGKNININGTINGDVYCAGQDVYINAVVNGDVICAGQNVTVDGTVNGSVRVIGQNVSVDASVARSASVVAENFSLDASSRVGRDLSAAGDNLDIKGSVGRDVVATANLLTFNGAIGRNVQVSGNTVDLKSNATISGSFNYTSDTRATVSKTAKVKGGLHQTLPSSSKGSSINFRLYLLLLISLSLFGLTVAYFFPHLVEQQGGYIKEHFTKALIVGVLASLVTPIIIGALIITTVGIPLAIFIVLAWLLGSALGVATVGYYAGSLMLRQGKDPLLITTLGMVVIVTFWSLPILGLVFLLLTYWLGVGTLLIGLNSYVRSDSA